jgi:hypothetical protein
MVIERHRMQRDQDREEFRNRSPLVDSWSAIALASAALRRSFPAVDAGSRRRSSGRSRGRRWQTCARVTVAGPPVEVITGAGQPCR